MSSSRIVVFGGTGFVGQPLISRLLARGHDVVVPTRNRAQLQQRHVQPQVRLLDADIYDDAQLRQLVDGAHAVINLVGILNEKGRNGVGFHKAHVTLTEKITDACRATGTRRLLQMSALNAGRGDSHYLRSRGEAEACVKRSGLDWTIFQPSVIFGPGDGLFERFAGLLRLFPVLPLARAETKFAPVYVADVADAFVRSLDDPATFGSSYELYGPDVMSLRQIAQYTADCLGKRRLILPLPDALARLQAAIMDFVPGKPFSTDNFLSLKLDSVGGVDGLFRLGIDKTRVAEIIPTQLHGSLQRRYDRYRRTRL